MNNVQSVFIYLTERCILQCSYCYIRHPSRAVLSWPTAERFLGLFGRELPLPAKFVISGGEPYLCPDLLKRCILEIRQRFGSVSLKVQSNGMLLDQEKISFLGRTQTGLEVGIDGGPASTVLHRRGMGAGGFSRLVKNIHKAVKTGVSVGCTMTVHPDQVSQMEENFAFLLSLGLSSIDVTPAAFMPWDAVSVRMFQENYLRIIGRQAEQKRVFLADDRQLFYDPLLDVSLHPPGYVLCGDAYLCLSSKVKKEYSLWSRQSGRWNPERFKFFQKKYAVLWKDGKGVCYRDYIRRSFHIVDQIAGGDFLNVRPIDALMRFLSLAHLRALLR